MGRAEGGAPQRGLRLLERYGSWAVVLAYVLPVPSALIYAAAGWTGMSLRRFLALDLLGTALWVGLIVGLGYGIGRPAVHIATLVSRYSLWVTIGLVLAIVLWTTVRSRRAMPPGGDCVDAMMGARARARAGAGAQRVGPRQGPPRVVGGKERVHLRLAGPRPRVPAAAQTADELEVGEVARGQHVEPPLAGAREHRDRPACRPRESLAAGASRAQDPPHAGRPGRSPPPGRPG